MEGLLCVACGISNTICTFAYLQLLGHRASQMALLKLVITPMFTRGCDHEQKPVYMRKSQRWSHFTTTFHFPDFQAGFQVFLPNMALYGLPVFWIPTGWSWQTCQECLNELKEPSLPWKLINHVLTALLTNSIYLSVCGSCLLATFTLFPNFS